MGGLLRNALVGGMLAVQFSLIAFPVWADTGPEGPTSIKLHGFGTLGLARSDDDAAGFVRDLSQPHGAGTDWTAKVDSLLGLQANFSLSPQTEGILQVVSRYRFDGSRDPELTWAFLRHDFMPEYSLRLGRLGTEFYMLGDSRLVGYSNVAVRPSPDFFGSLVFSYVDGLDLSAAMPVASGVLRGKLFAGQSPERAPFGFGYAWNLGGSPLFGGHLDYVQGPLQVRIGHAQVRFNHEIPIDDWLLASGINLGVPYHSLVPGMAMADRWARFNSLGLVYDEGPLSLQLMLNQISYDSPAYEDSRAGYLLAAYRLGGVTPYFGFSRSRSKADPLPPIPPIPGLAALTSSMVAQSHIDQHTLTLGARWDFRANMAIKGQVDWVRGEPTSLFLFKDVSPGWDGKATVFSLALDFVF